jgi:tRNA A-37 threonylcarbamoyl transferase component Bud32
MVNCPYCGTQNRRSASYCNNCGGALQGAPSAGAAGSGSAAAYGNHPTGRLPPSSRLAGCYLIEKVIGQGGMAAVYKAVDTRNNRPVAIKEMSQDSLSPSEVQEALESFRFEADTLMRLNHPNLPRVFGRFSEGARHYLVMEYIDGQTIEERQRAAGGKALPEREVMAWADQVCSVLTYLHMQRPPIIFRDLKPGNVMITSSGRVKLIDFGIARVFTPGRIRDTQALGTPGFAPPEQYGKAQTDARADVYGLGCTLYQMLSGYDPATTPFALPPLSSRNPDISPHIQFAIERATKLDRDQRYATAEDFRRALLYPKGMYFRSGDCARSLSELVTLCRRFPVEAEDHLYIGRIQGWLTTWGERKAAKAAADAARHKDRRTGLAAFLASVQPAKATSTSPRTTARPRTTAGPARSTQGTATAAAATAAPAGTATVVVVQPRTVDFGTLTAGQRGTVTITISGQNGASVQGAISAFEPWLRVDRAQFSGGSTLVQIAAETSQMKGFGAKQSSLQIRSGNQNVYVPVNVEVVPARGATAGPRKTATPANPAVGVKYGGSTRHRRWGTSFLTGLVLAFGVSAALLLGLPGALALWWPQAMSMPPVAAAVLLAASLATVPAALTGIGGRTWAGRLPMTLAGALLGLLAALGSGATDLIGAWPKLVPNVPNQVPPGLLLLVAVFASLGATLGADSIFGRAMLSIWVFLRRRVTLLVMLGGLALGAWGGAVLVSGVGRGGLMPIGFLVGGLLGGLIAGRINRLVRRARYARVYP